MTLGEKWDEYQRWLNSEFADLHDKLNTIRDHDFTAWANERLAVDRVELAKALLEGTSYEVKPK